MKLRFTSRAADELEDILDYLTARSPSGARQVQQRIMTVTSHLLAYPYSGVLTSSGIRRLRVSPFPYLVFYEILNDDLIVIGIRHAARDPSSMPGD